VGLQGRNQHPEAGHRGARQVKLLSLAAKIIVFAVVGAFVLVPLAQTIIMSFVSTLPRDGIPEGHFSLVNYQNILHSPVLKEAILNSIIYVLLNVTLCLVIGLPAAYAFARYSFVGDRQLFFLLLIFRITPTVVLSLPIFVLFAQIGLVNTPVGIAIVHCVFNIPISIWILEGFISAVPREFDETAFLDGHSLVSFFFRHLIPAVAPGIGVTAFFCFIFSWVEVVLARILTTTGGKPITMAINALFGFRTDMGLVMAMTVLALVPGIAMIYFVRNHLAKGFAIRT
jgi:glycerol transport system permease protein